MGWLSWFNRSARVGVDTSTIWVRWAGPAWEATKVTATRARFARPRKWQAWTITRWPLVTKPSATSRPPSAAEPATKRLLFASKTPRSKSARLRRRARTRPVAGAFAPWKR